MLNIKYPPYKQLQAVDSFLQTGNVIIGGTDVKRLTARVMEEEGFPIPEDKLEEFIVTSFQDAVSTMVEYGNDVSTMAIEIAEKIHDRKWPGTTSWVTDYVELLLGKCIERNPFGVWDIFFRHGDLYIVYQGNYAEMMFSYLKSNKELPDFCAVIGHGLFNDSKV